MLNFIFVFFCMICMDMILLSIISVLLEVFFLRFLRFYYVYFSKTSWNCFFPPLTFFQIPLKFSDFRSRYCIFSVKRYYFQSFRILDYNICSIVREVNAAYMIWYIPNINTTYLSDKFGPKI